MKKIYKYSLGFLSGIINGLFGAGGGLTIVPLLKKLGLEVKKAHATSVCIILPISMLSLVIYLFNSSVDLKPISIYIPFGVVGAVAGTVLIKKMSNKLLKNLFAIIMIISGIRLLIK